jgi:beta-glucosidase
MNIVEATRRFEAWLRRQITVVGRDLDYKQMRADPPLPASRLRWKRLLLFSLFAAAAPYLWADDPILSSDMTLEQKVDGILKQLTLEEKVGLCSGESSPSPYGSIFRDVARLNIPGLMESDGPRGPHGLGPTTAFPSGVAFGSTWNPDLIQKAGQVMGNECRATNIRMLLGPGINIQRDPLGGRFFEYYTEDPFLNASLATAIVKGIQSEGVAACIKHYVCNNREDNRNFYMSMVDPRTLNEIYFPGFKAAVQDGGAWAVMTSANGVNGDFVSDSKVLLHDILIGKWGFTGVVLTDWLQTRSTEKAALAGLDISMPGGDCGFAQPLLDAVKAGHVPESAIDDMARRVLRLYGRVGLLDNRNVSQGAARNTPEHQAIARQVADEGIVLLKNANSLLPLDPDFLQSILVIGPSADKKFCIPGMGGSSWVQGPYEITPLQGITKALDDSKVQYLTTPDTGGFTSIPADVMEPVNGVKGFKALYYQAGTDQPVVNRVEAQLNFMWEMRGPDPSVKPAGFSAHFVGSIDPPADGSYTLRVTVGGAASIATAEGAIPILTANRAEGHPTATAVVQMRKGQPFYLRVAYNRQPGDASLNLEWETPDSSPDAWAKVDDAARAADAVIFVGGIDHSLDTEGKDRVNMDFPADQEKILNRLVAANPKTIAVLINGSPMEIGGWFPNIPAVIEAWYPGMEGGNAIADVLFGKVDPSGRLPFSWPKKLADSPSHAIGTEDNDRVDYKEGVMIGYRYFDTQSIEPEFPFGFGMSYTTFRFGPLHLDSGKNAVTGSLMVKNSGSRNGIETVQIYVHPLNPSIMRPVHELKAFKKVAISTGDSAEVDFSLGPDAFSYFDEQTNQWKFDPGQYEIQVGSSSRDILSKTTINVRGMAAEDPK